MRKRCAFIWLLILLAACSRPAVEAEPTSVPVNLQGAGSGVMVPLVRQLADRFVLERPHITIELDRSNSGRAAALLEAAEVDFALSTAPDPAPERLVQYPIARDSIAIIVHPDNPVQNLTLRDLAQLYSGKIVNWRAVQGSSGPDLAVQVVTREPGSGLGAIFQRRILGQRRMTPNARVFPNGVAVVNYISQHPQAIGYASQSQVTDSVKLIAVEEILPSLETTANAAYPLTYLLRLVLPEQPDLTVQAFVDFILGPAGQSMLASWGMGRIR